MSTIRSQTLVTATEFKARCLEFMDEVSIGRARYLITKRGKVVAELVPASETVASPLGWMAGTAITNGDIVAPDSETWQATGDPLDQD